MIARAQTDPTWFIEEVLGSNLWAKQKQIVESVRDNPRTAVKSCHGAGKSYTAARIAIWFLSSFPQSIVLTTAPTFRQVRRVLWKEINSAYRNATIPLGAKSLDTELRYRDDWFALGFSTDDPDAFQGHHAEYILVILDEAAGVDPDIWIAVDGVLSSRHARLLTIGNPTEMGGPFYDEFRYLPSKAKIHIAAADTPNLQAGKVIIPGLVTPDWVADKKLRWGINSPMYQSRVLGEFPEASTDQLIPLSWVEAAQRREIEPLPRDEPCISVDVARFGDDETIIGLRHGAKFRFLSCHHGLRGTEVAGHVIKHMRDTDAARVLIEGAGSVGVGPIDIFVEQNIPVVELIPGGQPMDTDIFLNARAEWWWAVRERFESGEMDIPDDEELAAQLTALKYNFTSRGKIQIESKDDMKKRGMSSPDRADALMLAFARHAETMGEAFITDSVFSEH